MVFSLLDPFAPTIGRSAFSFSYLAEERAHFGGEGGRLLHRRKVAARRHFRPANDIIGSLGRGPGRIGEKLRREERQAGRDRYARASAWPAQSTAVGPEGR